MCKRTALVIPLLIILVLSLVISGCQKTATSTTTSATTAPVTSAAPTTTKTSAAATSTAASTTAAATTSASSPVATTPKKGGILTIISASAPTTWGYPVKAGAGFASIFAALPVLEGFIDADLKGNILPKLAASWEIASDKSSITFKLRQGVKFHDGTPFNAEAAKWNLDLFIARGTGSPADWKSIDILDEYTIRINLKSFKNTQLSNMTYNMISPTSVQKNGADWAGINPVGTGPFKFKNFVANTSLEYTRNDDYWGDVALVDGIKYIYIVDATTAAMAYKAGDALVWEEADAKTGDSLYKSGYQRLTRRGAIRVLSPDSANADSPFAKKLVREAVEYAIDRQAIVDAFGYGIWEPVYQSNVSEQFGHVADLTARKYDPEKAKELLTQAGYPNGFSTKIITSSAFPKDPLVAIQGNLEEIGIKIEFDVQAPAKWAETRTSGWSNGMFYVTHGSTDYNYCAYLERYFTPNSGYMAKSMALPEGWVDMITKMMLVSDKAEMTKMAQQATRVEVENIIEIPLWVEAAVYIADPSVHDMGVGTHGDGFSWNTNKVWIDK